MERRKLAGEARFHVFSSLLRCQQQKHISGWKRRVTAERCACTLFDVPGKPEHNSGCRHDMSSVHDSIHTRACACCVKLSGFFFFFFWLGAGGRCVTEPRNCGIYSSRLNLCVRTVGGCSKNLSGVFFKRGNRSCQTRNETFVTLKRNIF